jgi:flagellar assembly factor FliW
MPWLHTAHFGALEYTPASTLKFGEGLPGFESEHSFLLVERPAHHPLVFLQSVTSPELCFPALPIQVIERGYQPQLGDSDVELLGFPKQPCIGEDAVILVLIAMHEQDPTANLLAPIVINLRTRAAAQCIDPDMRYSHRYPLLPILEAAS